MPFLYKVGFFSQYLFLGSLFSCKDTKHFNSIVIVWLDKARSTKTQH